jgi:hypothetical protein
LSPELELPIGALPPDAALDLDNPAHLAALLRAYERFPEIGGRSAP